MNLPANAGDLASSEARAHPLAFYRKFFAGWTPEDLSARAPIVYERLRRRGLLRLIPGETPLPFGGDPLAYYRQHYAGLTRGQLHDQTPELYEHCRRNGLLAHIPLKPKISFPDPPRLLPRALCGDDAQTGIELRSAVLPLLGPA